MKNFKNINIYLIIILLLLIIFNCLTNKNIENLEKQNCPSQKQLSKLEKENSDLKNQNF